MSELFLDTAAAVSRLREYEGDFASRFGDVDRALFVSACGPDKSDSGQVRRTIAGVGIPDPGQCTGTRMRSAPHHWHHNPIRPWRNR